jgi:hypothetical protein
LAAFIPTFVPALSLSSSTFLLGVNRLDLLRFFLAEVGVELGVGSCG